MARGVGVLEMTLMAALSVGIGGAPASTAQQLQRRPVSLISSRLLMVQGRAAVPVADLAQALGGVVLLDEPAFAYRISPGATNLLRFDATGRGVAPRARRIEEGRETVGPAEGAGSPPSLYIGNVLVAERLIVQGREPYVLLEDLAEMFGGAARFDAALGQWFIVGDQPGRILAFR